MVIEYVDFERKLRELNSDIHFDETKTFRYPYDPDGRTGIMHHNEHVCNVSRGTMREEDTIGKPGFYEDVVDANEALLLKNRTSGNYIMNFYQLTPDVESLWAEVQMKLDGADRGIIFLGGTQVTVERMYGWDAEGDFIQNLLVRVYTKKALMDSCVIRLGWRDVLETILTKRIPNLTRETLSEKFNVELVRGKQVGKSFKEIVEKAMK